MSDSWDDYAQDWDNNPDVIQYAQLAFETLSQRYDVSGLKVLDFGCGTGLLSEKLAQAGAHVVSVDPSIKMIEILVNKKISQVQVLACEISPQTIAAEPLLSNDFDLVVASSVCTFLPDFSITLASIASLLKPEGVFVQWDWMSSDANPNFGFDRQTILQAYERAGLSLVDVAKGFTLTLNKGSMDVIMGIAQKFCDVHQKINR